MAYHAMYNFSQPFEPFGPNRKIQSDVTFGRIEKNKELQIEIEVTFVCVFLIMFQNRKSIC